MPKIQLYMKLWKGPTKHLPMVSNGLPPPLEKQVVDISMNPGRFKMCKGYIEVSASPMWLGKHFWELTGATRGALDSIYGLEITERDDVLRISFPSTPFCDESTADLQNALRAVLFPSQK